MRRLLPVLLAFVLVACAGDDETTSAPSSSSSSSSSSTTVAPTAEAFADGETCTSESFGFNVRYPAGWHTTSGSVTAACTFFHPEPFELEEDTEPPPLAVRIDRVTQELDEFVANVVANAEEVSRERLEIDGRAAVALEVRTTRDQPMTPAGTRVTYVAVDGPEATLVVVASERGGLEYERNREVARDMATTLRFGPKKGGA